VPDRDRLLLRGLFDAAVNAAHPATALTGHLPAPPKGRTVVIGAGKGAAQLGQAFERLWPGPLSGVIVTRYGHGAVCDRLRVIEAAHPVPDAAGAAATSALSAAVQGLGPDDLVVALITGGGSALLPAPVPGLTLDDEIALNRTLLASGAPIGAMNAIRKQLSGIKGGRLAALARPARVVSLVVSDVPGDDPGQVASGPTVASPGGTPEALAAVADHRIDLPDRLRAALAAAPPPPDPTRPDFARDSVRVIASAGLSLEAAAHAAAAAGLSAHILSDAVEGEAREVGRVHAALAREIALRDRPFAKPCVLLSGGETTVSIGSGPAGRGGRNGEFLLGFALAAQGVAGMTALAADTDGIDGSEANAGAFADATSCDRLRRAGLDPAALLSRHDSWTAFNALGDLFAPGPTGTNVNDFRAIILR